MKTRILYPFYCAGLALALAACGSSDEGTGGNSGADGGNQAADGGGAMADGGNAGADGGNQMTDGGSTGADGGEQMADAGAAVPDSGEQVPDSGNAGSDGGSEASVGSIHGEGTFDVEVTEDLVYAQGLVHADWRSAESMPMDLLLDVYQPVRDNPPKMPVIVFIHGGGFRGGSHKKPEFQEMARSFASRGWVAFSIDYRVLSHHGTLPPNYPEPPIEVSDMERLDQWYAFYPACRDAKAAIRWIRSRANEYSINTDYITALGGSAGSFIAVALGVTNEDDCVNDVSEDDDATLAGTHLDQSSSIRTIIDHWGGTGIVRALELMTPGARFDATDAPISIIHGRRDRTVPFSQAEEIKAEYDRTGVPYAWYPLDDEAHAPWRVEVGDKNLTELAFDFIVEQQGLELE